MCWRASPSKTAKEYGNRRDKNGRRETREAEKSRTHTRGETGAGAGFCIMNESGNHDGGVPPARSVYEVSTRIVGTHLLPGKDGGMDGMEILPGLCL
jgi:hypothetical protein